MRDFQAGFSNLIVLLITIIGILIGIFLVQKPQIFEPQANVYTSPATSFKLSANKTKFNVNEKFKVKLLVRSDAFFANNFTANLSFPGKLLKVTSIKTSRDTAFFPTLIPKAFAQSQTQGFAYCGMNDDGTSYICQNGLVCDRLYLSVPCADTASCIKKFPKGNCVPRADSTYTQPAISPSPASTPAPSPSPTPEPGNSQSQSCAGFACQNPNDPTCFCSPSPSSSHSQAPQSSPANLNFPTPSPSPSQDFFITRWSRKEFNNTKGTVFLSGKVENNFKTTISQNSPVMVIIEFQTKAKGRAKISFSNSSAILRSEDNINILNKSEGLTINILGPNN